MVNWFAPDVVAWTSKAEEDQQWLYEKLGDRIWDHIKASEVWVLKKKIGFALYGEPSSCCDDLRTLGYTVDEEKEIHRICKLIYEKSGKYDVCVAFIFVFGKMHEKKFCVPVFKVLAHGKSVFIDSLGRSYQGWSDFKANNKLPKSLLCYPAEGTYQGGRYLKKNVIVEFSTSPACHVGPVICSALDRITNGVGLVAAGVGVVGLAVPLAAPVAVASTVGLAVSGIYGLFRGSHHLHDRRIHDQTISPLDRDAQSMWISVMGASFGIGSAMGVARAATLAASGGVLGKTSAGIINFFNFGCLTFSGLSAVNGLAYLVDKSKKDELTPLDVFRWSASVIFFFNAAVNIKTANGIVRDVQEGMRSDFSRDLSMLKTRSVQFMKDITSIGSKGDFLQSFTSGGLSSVGRYGQLFTSMKSGLNYFAKNQNEAGVFISKNVILKLHSQTSCLMKKVNSEMNKNSIKIDGKSVFELNDDHVSKLSQVFVRYCDIKQDEGKKKQEMVSMLAQAENLAQNRSCPTEETFINYYEFICIYKTSLLKKMMRNYEEERAKLISELVDDYDNDAFNNKWSIQDSDNIEEEFLKKINLEIKLSDSKLLKEFDKYNREIMILNEMGNVKFRTCAEALVEFYRSYVIDLDERLTLNEYFKIIRKVVEEGRPDNSVSSDKDICYHCYSDISVPVCIEVCENNGTKYFVTTVFKDLEMQRNETQSNQHHEINGKKKNIGRKAFRSYIRTHLHTGYNDE